MNEDLQRKLNFIEKEIERHRRQGYPDAVVILRSIAKDMRAQTREVQQEAHRALAHHVQAHKRRLEAFPGLTPSGEGAAAVAAALVAHWPAVDHAMRNAAQFDELTRLVKIQRDLITALEEEGTGCA